MDKTQLGRAGELAIALYSIVSSDGELQLFTPVADDDHIDATAGRRGGMPAIAIQVKTAREVDRNGSVEATDFNRLAYRHTAGDREILEFRGDPVRDDRYSSFRLAPLDIGPRLLSVIDSLEEGIPLGLLHGAEGLMLAARPEPNRRRPRSVR